MFKQQDKITREDLSKIKKSIKDPRFNEILEDYMLEISNPKNKEEQDKYLLQLEKEGDLPKHLFLIQPRKFFCIQTSIASEVNYNYSQTLYINICLNQEIQESKIGKQKENGANWIIPYQIGKQRYDQDLLIDNEKKVVTVIDVCFNDNIEYLCNINAAFKKMIADSAIEGVQKKANERKEKIDKDYKYVQNLQCKGGQPSIMPIQKKNEKKDIKEKTKLYHEIMNIKNQNEQNNDMNQIQDKKQEQKENQNPICPEYKIIYQYQTESEDYYETKYRKKQQIKNIKIIIKLPKVQEINAIQCDIDEQYNLILEYKDIYYLNCQINQQINKEQYIAKFDKQKKQLQILFDIVKKIQKPNLQSYLVKNDQNNQNLQVQINSSKENNNHQKNLIINQQSKSQELNKKNAIQKAKEIQQSYDFKQDVYKKLEGNQDNQKEKIIKDNKENQNEMLLNCYFKLYNQQKIDNNIFITFKIYQQGNFKIIKIEKEIILFNMETCDNITLRFEIKDFKFSYKIIKNYATIIIENEEQINYKQKKIKKILLQKYLNELKQQNQQKELKQVNYQKKSRNQKIDEDEVQDLQETKNNFDFLILGLNKEVFNIYQLIQFKEYFQQLFLYKMRKSFLEYKDNEQKNIDEEVIIVKQLQKKKDQNETQCFNLKYNERLGAFLFFNFIGYLLQLGSVGKLYDSIFNNTQPHFAFYYSIGTLLSLVGTFIFMGFKKQLRLMKKEKRRNITTLFIISTFLSLIFPFIFSSNLGKILTIIVVIIQMFSYWMYTFTFFPRLRQCLYQCGGGIFGLIKPLQNQ